jgi:type III pantothenate kinase
VILLLDIGNSRIKWALTSGPGLTDTSAVAHHGSGLLPAALTRLRDLDPPTAIVAATVARGAVTDALEALALSEWGRAIRYASVLREGYGVTCGYHQLRRLGVDRWVALVAARQLLGGAVGVVDAGTAVTMDFMGATGRHLGGVIFPGPDLMRRSLSSGADQLGLVREGTADVFARDTDDAIFAGTILAVAGAIDSIRDRMQARGGPEATWLLTGGAAAELEPHLRGDYRHEPLLVLEGLRMVAPAY